MWSAMTINIGRRGSDGRTAWELRHGKEFKRPVADLFELVLFQPESKQASRITPKFLEGIFLGLVLRSNDIYVGTTTGDVVVARSFKLLPDNEANRLKARKLYQSLRGTPWEPKPSAKGSSSVRLDTGSTILGLSLIHISEPTRQA